MWRENDPNLLQLGRRPRAEDLTQQRLIRARSSNGLFDVLRIQVCRRSAQLDQESKLQTWAKYRNQGLQEIPATLRPTKLSGKVSCKCRTSDQRQNRGYNRLDTL